MKSLPGLNIILNLKHSPERRNPIFPNEGDSEHKGGVNEISLEDERSLKVPSAIR